MKASCNRLQNIVAPTAESLWQRAMADERACDDLPEGTRVPFFSSGFVRHEKEDSIQLLYHQQQAYGTRQTFETETTHGIGYKSYLYQPVGGNRHDFYIDIDTPLMTGVDGLNDEVAARFMREIGVPVIMKGPEFSAQTQQREQRLADIALSAMNISQSFSAQMSMEISGLIVESENLPRTAVAYGKSRGAMIGGKKHSYAQDEGINIAHYRLIDPCCGERAFDNPADIVRYPLWPASDVLKSLPSFARFALEGKLRSRMKTVKTDLPYLVGALAGTVPSLLSGEPMGDRIPLQKGVSLVSMANNPIADRDAYLDQFKNHPHFDYHEIRDTHVGGIILPRNIRRSVRHIKEFASEYDRVDGEEALINWDNVHNNPRKAGSTAA